MGKHCIFVDPSYEAFYKGAFFQDSALNRDDMLRPYIRLKEELSHRDVLVDTADRMPYFQSTNRRLDYYSFGVMDNLVSLTERDDVCMKGFCIFEPPAVLPGLYDALPMLTQVFENVFLHNVEGDGYALDGVDEGRLQKLYWPQPYNYVLEPFWSNTERHKKVVVINGNHKSPHHKELYSTRIEAMVALSKYGLVDLYGGGWDRWWKRSSMWMPYWRNIGTIEGIYQGYCKSKFETLSNYEFCLCFENMIMDGYMTEKLFDCLYAGCVPLYLGAPDIGKYVPKDVYFDVSQQQGWQGLIDFVQHVSPEKIQSMREAGKQFLESESMNPFYDSLHQIIKI